MIRSRAKTFATVCRPIGPTGQRPELHETAIAMRSDRDYLEWVEPAARGIWVRLVGRLARRTVIHLRSALGSLSLMLTLTLPVTAQEPAAPPPGPRPAPPSPEPKPRPVVLDPAAVARLREAAFEAARAGNVKRLEDYFQAGQPADIANARGDSLLILACYHGHDDAVKLILDQPKTPIDARNKMGFTALTGAAYKGYTGIVRQLAAKKADLNSADERGQTALMYAAMFGRTEVVQFLVDRKVDLRAKDAAGKTARDLARVQGKTDAEKILEAAEKPRPPVE